MPTAQPLAGSRLHEQPETVGRRMALVSVASNFTPGEPVKICIQSSDPAVPNRAFSGLIEDLQKKQLLLVADEEAQENAQLTAQTKYLLYMGNVLNSYARPDGKWDIAVAVRQMRAMI